MIESILTLMLLAVGAIIITALVFIVLFKMESKK
jgi:hypothetical protein